MINYIYTFSKQKVPPEIGTGSILWLPMALPMHICLRDFGLVPICVVIDEY